MKQFKNYFISCKRFLPNYIIKLINKIYLFFEIDERSQTMKKRFLTIATVALMSLGAVSTLASCNGGGDTSQTSSVTDGSNPGGETSSTRLETTTGTGVNSFDMYVPNGEFEHTRLLVDAFNAKVAAKREADPAFPDLSIKLKMIDMSEGDVGNVFNTSPESCPLFLHVPGNNANDWAKNDKLVSFGDTSSVVSAVNGEALNVPELAYVTSGGATYGAAFTVNTFFLIYNKKVYSAEDVVSIDKMETALKEYNQTHTAEEQYDFGLGMDFGNGWQMQSFFFRAGVKLQGEDGTDASANGFTVYQDQVVLNTQDMIYMLQHNVDKGTGSTGPFSYAIADATAMDVKANVSVASYVSGTWDIDKIAQSVGGIENVGCAVLPEIYTAESVEAGSPETTPWPMIQDYKSIVLNNSIYKNLTDVQKQAAREFFYFMFTPEGQAKRYEGTTITPALTETPIETDAALNYVANEAILGAATDNSFVQPSTTGWNSYWDGATAFYADYIGTSIGTDGKATKLATSKNDVWDNVSNHSSGSTYYNNIKEGVAAIAKLIEPTAN